MLQVTYEANVAWTAAQAAIAGRDVLTEPINTRDNPGLFLSRQNEAHRIVQLSGAPISRLSSTSTTACQIVDGDVANRSPSPDGGEGDGGEWGVQ